MKNLNVPLPTANAFPASRFRAAKAMAYTFALADPDLIEPELEGCSGPCGRRDYGISHDGRLEINVNLPESR